MDSKETYLRVEELNRRRKEDQRRRAAQMADNERVEPQQPEPAHGVLPTPRHPGVR